MLPEYISGTDLTETDTRFSIEFRANEAFAQLLAQEACATLYQNPDILTNMAQTFTTDRITCYLHVDKATGFPVASGFHYEGTYIVSALPYKLVFKADQNYAIENTKQ